MTTRLPLLALAMATAPAAAQQPARAVAVAPAVQNVWPDEQFDNWALGVARTPDGLRKRFDSLLTLQVDEIDRACTLTDAQRAKLRLLGAGDAKRVLDAFAAAKRRFKELGNDMNQIQQVVPLVQPVQLASRTGPFMPGSLFAKGLRHALTPEQLAKYEAVTAERQAFRHKAQVELAVHTLEESVPLKDGQRAVLIDLLLKETRPIRATGQYDYYLLMHQLDRVPEEKVRPLLTDTQMKAWAGLTGRHQAVIQNLRQAGILVDDDDVPPVGGLKK